MAAKRKHSRRKTAIITGGLATAMSVATTNGTGRIYVEMNIPVASEIFATPINQIPKFGVSQYTAVT